MGSVRRSSTASISANGARRVDFRIEVNSVQNLVDAGVIDPTKVVRVAIQNASSIAGLLLTTEAIISEMPEKKKAAPPMPGGGGYEDFD